MTKDTVRDRVVRAAVELLEADPDAFSTRSVSAAAGVQAPTLYRLFGDKEGLVQAAVSWAFEEYMARKRAQALTDDPVADLRAAWDVHVRFGLEHPVLYQLMFGDGGTSPAARRGEEVLAGLLGRIAAVGRLACSIPRAVALVHGTAMGMVLFTLARPEAERDLLFRYRYLLSPAVTPALFETPGLRAKLEALLDGIVLEEKPASRQRRAVH